MKIRFFLALTVLYSISGCSTSQNIGVGKFTLDKPITSVAHVLEDENSSDMNTNLKIALQKQGLNVQQTLSAGTRTSDNADALVTYADSWSWDIVMYLRSFTLKVYDAKSGEVLAISEWHNSVIHRFSNSADVVQKIVSETFDKINSNIKPTAVNQK